MSRVWHGSEAEARETFLERRSEAETEEAGPRGVSRCWMCRRGLHGPLRCRGLMVGAVCGCPCRDGRQASPWDRRLDDGSAA